MYKTVKGINLVVS